jgi:hypothetical protein
MVRKAGLMPRVQLKPVVGPEGSRPVNAAQAPDEVLLIDDLAQLLKTSRDTIERRIRAGSFPFLRFRASTIGAAGAGVSSSGFSPARFGNPVAIAQRLA